MQGILTSQEHRGEFTIMVYRHFEISKLLPCLIHVSFYKGWRVDVHLADVMSCYNQIFQIAMYGAGCWAQNSKSENKSGVAVVTSGRQNLQNITQFSASLNQFMLWDLFVCVHGVGWERGGRWYFFRVFKAIVEHVKSTELGFTIDKASQFLWYAKAWSQNLLITKWIPHKRISFFKAFLLCFLF